MGVAKIVGQATTCMLTTMFSVKFLDKLRKLSRVDAYLCNEAEKKEEKKNTEWIARRFFQQWDKPVLLHCCVCWTCVGISCPPQALPSPQNCDCSSKMLAVHFLWLTLSPAGIVCLPWLANISLLHLSKRTICLLARHFIEVPGLLLCISSQPKCPSRQDHMIQIFV